MQIVLEWNMRWSAPGLKPDKLEPVPEAASVMDISFGIEAENGPASHSGHVELLGRDILAYQEQLKQQGHAHNAAAQDGVAGTDKTQCRAATDNKHTQLLPG